MRRIAFLLALAVVGSGTLASAQGTGSGVRIKIEYYSDPGLANQTGEFVEFCDGTSAMNGRPDIYSTYMEYSC